MLGALAFGFFQGAVYGLLAVGLVLVYKGARVFNFAQGEFGSVAAFVTYQLFAVVHLPYGVAAFLGLAAAVITGLVIERLVVRPLLGAPRVTLLVATVGVTLFVIAVTVLVVGPNALTLQPIVHGTANLFGADVTFQQMLLVVVLGGLAAVLAFFFRRTDTGLAVLATSQDPFATRVVGISVPAMSRVIWGSAALLGGIAGLLQAPIGVMVPGFMTTTSLLPAFTAAVLGGMTSLPGAFIGGELVGMAQSLGIYVLGQHPGGGLGVPGASELSVFIVLLLVLLIRPRGILGREA